jgi:predicted enzyme related to lactoylglutathione lyase
VTTGQPKVAISHIAICTSDVARSVRFYTEALGFTLDRAIDGIGAPFDTLMELPGVTCNVHYMKCGETTIELIGYPGGEVSGPSERRPMNQLGFTHMTLVVDDVDAMAARIADCGGQAHPETRIDTPMGPMLFCTDPDGVRIELIQNTG